MSSKLASMRASDPSRCAFPIAPILSSVIVALAICTLIRCTPSCRGYHLVNIVKLCLPFVQTTCFGCMRLKFSPMHLRIVGVFSVRTFARGAPSSFNCHAFKLLEELYLFSTQLLPQSDGAVVVVFPIFSVGLVFVLEMELVIFVLLLPLLHVGDAVRCCCKRSVTEDFLNFLHRPIRWSKLRCVSDRVLEVFQVTPGVIIAFAVVISVGCIPRRIFCCLYELISEIVIFDQALDLSAMLVEHVPVHLCTRSVSAKGTFVGSPPCGRVDQKVYILHDWLLLKSLVQSIKVCGMTGFMSIPFAHSLAIFFVIRCAPCCVKCHLLQRRKVSSCDTSYRSEDCATHSGTNGKRDALQENLRVSQQT
mmetsp:Transcript_23085/g.36884  ORF Transcript_23085/g.36884 Transcript_23085/m.36884 type:complete len:363 (-) Transcript_23085:16-1104(-)